MGDLTEAAASETMGRSLLRAVIVTGALILAKVVGAWWSHSLALWADAGHSLTDIVALALSWYAWRQAQRPPTETLTFGYARSEVLAALANSLGLVVVAGALAWEAVGRFAHPVSVQPLAMAVTAGVAIAVDVFLALGFRGSSNLNVRSAWLHLMSDAAGSLGVVVSAGIVALSGWSWVDPAVTIGISALIVATAWGITKEAVAVLMEAAPSGVRLGDVLGLIQGVQGVKSVHDVHVWSVSSGRNALACHLQLDTTATLEDSQAVLHHVESAVAPLGITHVTIQVETPDKPDGHAPW